MREIADYGVREIVLEDDRFVLTASTRDLQRFVLKHLAEGELFDKPGEMVRHAKPAER